MKQLVAWAARCTPKAASLVLCGDINIARTEVDVHPRERKPGIIGQRPEERALFERLLGEHLVDVGRTLDPDNERLFTWWPPWRNMRARNIGWRLDYVLASKPSPRAQSCRVLAEVGTSDHAPVMMTTSLGALLRDHARNDRVLRHAAPVVGDLGQVLEIHAVAFQPLRECEEIHVADGVARAHDPGALEHFVLDQREALGDRLWNLLLHGLDHRRVIGPAVTAHAMRMRHVDRCAQVAVERLDLGKRK